MKKLLCILLLFILSESVQAATSLANVVSRANCGAYVPFLGDGAGWYNESVSYDWSGKVSNKYKHKTYTESHQFVSGRLDLLIKSPAGFQVTWRSYAGRTLPFSDKRFFKVTGKHWEYLDGQQAVRFRTTYATGCNLV